MDVALFGAPTNGSAPLDVAFTATVSPSNTAAAFLWAFGDGSNYTENATGSATVEHRYGTAGAFVATVHVTTSGGAASASLVVDVSADPLQVHIGANPLTGTAPLTITFTASPSGGTGTYPTLVWSFGDGDNGSGTSLQYTFTRPGNYTVSAVVTDSSGATNSSSVRVDVTAAPSATPADGPTSYDPTWFLIGAVALLGVAAGVVIFSRFAGRRPPDLVPDPPTAPSREPVLVPSSPPAPSPETMAATTTPGSRTEESRQLSERILVHLYWFGRPSAEGVSRADASQAGMARRLGVTQNGVSKALQRLLDAGLVRVELQHVPGASRRVKTYALTAKGEAIVRVVGPDRPAP